MMKAFYWVMGSLASFLTGFMFGDSKELIANTSPSQFILYYYIGIILWFISSIMLLIKMEEDNKKHED